MDKFTQSSQYFHRAPLVISFLSTHRSHGRNAPPNFSFGQSFFRFVDHILDEAFCVVADGLPVNVFHVWRIEVGATEDIRQIFFFCDRSDKGKSAKQVIALHDGKVFDIYFATVVVWLGGDIAACCKIVALTAFSTSSVVLKQEKLNRTMPCFSVPKWVCIKGAQCTPALVAIP